jgi:hypothetical protein
VGVEAISIQGMFWYRRHGQQSIKEVSMASFRSYHWVVDISEGVIELERTRRTPY